VWRLVRETFTEFSEDECPRLAASLAYYAIFSLPALLVVVVSVAGLFFKQEDVAERVTFFFREIMGERGANQIGAMLQHASLPQRSWWGSLVGFGMLLVGATGVLAELQTALNRAWRVKPDPRRGGVQAFLMKRVLSLGMVLGIAFLLLVSLIISWLLTEFSALAQSQAPGWISPGVLHAIDQVGSLAIITLLFAAMLKFLPDVRLDWTDVWAGAVLTALLFVAGKVGLGFYLAWADPTTAFGAAGSLALVLVWIYYSGMIFFLGAEFTHVYARHRGRRAAPEEGAVKDEDASRRKPEE